MSFPARVLSSPYSATARLSHSGASCLLISSTVRARVLRDLSPHSVSAWHTIFSSSHDARVQPQTLGYLHPDGGVLDAVRPRAPQVVEQRARGDEREVDRGGMGALYLGGDGAGEGFDEKDVPEDVVADPSVVEDAQALLPARQFYPSPPSIARGLTPRPLATLPDRPAGR
jgi:hypothetical protein